MLAEAFDMNTKRLLRSKIRTWAAPAAALLALVAMPPLLHAQEGGAIAGTIVAQGNQRPLAGVEVAAAAAGAPVKNTLTDASGRFRITGLTGTRVVLNVRVLGFRPVTDTVNVGTTDLHIEMSERVIELNSVVVTGTAGGAQKRELGTSVAVVSAEDIQAQTAVPTVQGLITGRAPGVDVISATGQVGAGSQIRVRGVGSFSLSGTPLIYIDGVRTNNNQTGIVSRFNDINPEEIASIEVLKGPAAATLYGTEAARGVVNIITKRGTQGSSAYNFSAQSGNMWFNNAEGRMRTNYWLNPVTKEVWSLNMVKSEKARGTPLFRTGDTHSFTANSSGGSGIYRHFVGAEFSEAQGIVPSNDRIQKNARANLSIVPTNKVSIETSAGYLTSKTTTAGEGGSAGAIWGQFALPQRTVAACPYLYPAGAIPRGCGWARGSIVSPPEVYAQTQNWQDVRRFTGSVSLKYEPFSWLSNRLLVGTDYTMEDLNTLLPYQTDSVIVFFLGSRFDGSRAETTQQTTYNTYDYAATAKYDVKKNISAKSTLGLQYYTNKLTTLTASGQHFPTPGVSTISATGLKAAPTSGLTANNTVGSYVQQEFALQNRLFLTGALRVDNNSAFGSEAKFTTYPKVSASWVASDEPSLRSHIPGFIDELRVRGAFGGSGQQPLTNSALRTLAPVAGPNGQTTLTNSTIGNPDLKPERVLGTELGLEAGLFNDRIGIDLTLYRDVSKDAILASTVAPSTAFGASTQFVNAGQINKKGFELALKGQVLSTRRYGWDMQFNVAATKSDIIKLGSGADSIINVTGGNTSVGTVGVVFHRVGYSPFDIFTYKILSATYDPATQKATNLICDNGKGGTVPCFVPGTSSLQAPPVYVGHSLPTTTGSLINTFRFAGFRLYAMIDFQRGFKKTDTNYEQVCQVFLGCLENIYPEKYNPIQVAHAQDGSGRLQDFYIRDGNFAKLREISLSYDATPKTARLVGARSAAVTLTARNLHMWTKYTGLDPENSVNTDGGMSRNLATDQTEFPQLATVLIGIRLGY
jgi:TonB-linked SusC/RagA family outer membrane protein